MLRAATMFVVMLLVHAIAFGLRVNYGLMDDSHPFRPVVLIALT